LSDAAHNLPFKIIESVGQRMSHSLTFVSMDLAGLQLLSYYTFKIPGQIVCNCTAAMTVKHRTNAIPA
jgi:hypothetical protein